jgi:predicted alpha/beta superfamily hydrolase
MTRKNMFSALAAATLISVGGLASMAVAQSAQPVQITRSHVHHLASQAVGDGFTIQVRIPESYEAGSERFPVVYVLDSDIWFGVATDMADNLPAESEMPEVIVVGISYGGSLGDWWDKRSRDLTPSPDPSNLWGEFPLAGGAAKFQEFFATELIPFIDSSYRTKENDRALAGLSFGGLFGAYTLFTRPELFQRYVLIAPSLAWNERGIWATEADYRAAHRSLPAIVYTAVGDRDEKENMLVPWRDFNRLIERRHYCGIRWFSQVFPDETHLSVYPSALTRGLKYIYAPAKPGKKEKK